MGDSVLNVQLRLKLTRPRPFLVYLKTSLLKAGVDCWKWGQVKERTISVAGSYEERKLGTNKTQNSLCQEDTSHHCCIIFQDMIFCFHFTMKQVTGLRYLSIFNRSAGPGGPLSLL